MLRLSVELFPDISYPSLTVQTEFPNTAPEEVEYLVTRPVEEVVGVLPGLETIHSVSRSGISEVTLEFDWDSDMDLLSMEIREKLDRLVLPEDAESPIVLRFDPSLDPILRVALSGDGPLTELRDFAERRLKQSIETVKGVASATVHGGLEKEIQIEVDQEKIAALGISLDHLQRVIGNSNLNLPGGVLRGVDNQYVIRTVNEFKTVDQIAELIVWNNEGAYVKLGEVAKVYEGAKDREIIARVNGKEAIEFQIFKEGDANTVTVADLVRARLKTWDGKLPKAYSLTVLFDQSKFIDQSVRGVLDAALLGGALAVLVLFAFLRDLRSTLIVATSIPISVIATFLVMYQADISLNIMSLGGLTLGIGMLVDNGIVVLESIFRKIQGGSPRDRAAVDGTVEVGPAVFASTLTTITVFVPMIFVEGVAGQLFKDQALTVTIAMIASLVIAVTVIPMLSGFRAGRRSQDQSQPAFADVNPARPVATRETLGVVSRLYEAFLRQAIRLRLLVVLSALFLFAVAAFAVTRLETELVPQLSEGEFFFEVNTAEGTSLAATDRIISDMESTAGGDPSIERYYSTVGSRLVTGGLSLNTKGENLGQMNVVMKDRLDREGEIRSAAALRERFGNVPDLQVKLGKPSYFSLKTPIEVIVFEEDLDRLQSLSKHLTEEVAALDGLADVRSSLEAGNPEIQIRFDRSRLAALGLSMSVLSETLKNRVQGIVPTRFKERDRQIDVRIRNFAEQRSSIEDVRNLVVPGPDGAPIRLLQVADIRLARGPAEIHRVRQQRASVITANLEGRSLGSAIAGIESTVAQASLPSGSDIELAGQNREMQVSFDSLKFALALAVFLVYLVMAATFESFIHPLIVLLTVPLSLFGVVAGLLLSGTTISVVVLIGGVMLVGIVVNNAIVLIDAINRMRRSGFDKVEAVVLATQTRLRPIVMTTLTTVLGLLPMAVAWGEGSELRAPLAVTVASGLLFSTLLTLVVIPAAYVLVPSQVSSLELSDAPATTADAAAEACP